MENSEGRPWWRREPVSGSEWVLTAVLVFAVCLVTGRAISSWTHGALVGLGMATGTLLQGGRALARPRGRSRRQQSDDPRFPSPPPGKRD